MQLDERARSASTALLDAVPDTFTNDAVALRPHRRLATIAIAAVVVAALIVGVALLRRGGETTTTNVTSDSSAIPRLIVDPPPSGTVAGGADLPLPDANTTMSAVVYGAATGDPLAGSLVAVTVAPSGGTLDSSGLPIKVGGADGQVRTADERTIVEWLAPDGRLVQVSGRGFDQQQLVAVAESVGAGTPLAVGAPPAGLVEVARADDLTFQGGLLSVGHRGAPGHVASYSDGPGSAVLTVTTTQGDAKLATLLRLLIADGGEPTVVRGHDGWRGPAADGGSGTFVVWQEAPGVIGMIAGAPATVDDSVDRLREATDTEWQAQLNGR